MIGGGEEYFAPPEEYSADTLARFATFSHKLRQLEKMGKKTIADLATEADLVGTSMAVKELVAGVVMRHIKMWTGKKQQCYWCLLDKMAKNHHDTYGFLFGLHLLDIGTDYIPWEDEKLFPVYEALVEHWDAVFPSRVVQMIWQSRETRKWNVENPEEYKKQREEEERIWVKEEHKHHEVDGLDYYEQPCLAYLQGTCQWGAGCTMLHPPGLEGSLPPECRLGDWKCLGCGAINRHFRRRCQHCPREKPQWKKDGMTGTAEETLLTNPDAKVIATFRERFGYDPCSETEAKEFWAKKFRETPVAVYLDERKEKYREILTNARSTATASTKRPAVAQDGADQDAQVPSDEPTLKKSRPESTSLTVPAPSASAASAVPSQQQHMPQAPQQQQQQQQQQNVVGITLPSIPTMTPRDRVWYLCGQVVSRGAHDVNFNGFLFLLAQCLRECAGDPRFTATPPTPEHSGLFRGCVQIVQLFWDKNVARGAAAQTSSTSKHPTLLFLRDVKKFLPLVPLAPQDRADVEACCNAALEAPVTA